MTEAQRLRDDVIADLPERLNRSETERREAQARVAARWPIIGLRRLIQPPRLTRRARAGSGCYGCSGTPGEQREEAEAILTQCSMAKGSRRGG
jgi:hypothetical protein